ncbi:MAG: hypothetical protein ACK4FK_14450 [Ferrovibrio sp.]|uniref:hypothetical protein n=1 Tax=Ferrovibrio sp. TaxID=1917215 RepID=UPI00391C67DF
MAAHIFDQILQGIDLLDHQASIDIGDIGGDDQILLLGHVARNQFLDFVGDHFGLERSFLPSQAGKQDQVILIIHFVMHIGRIKATAEDGFDQAVNVFDPLRPAGTQYLAHILQAYQLHRAGRNLACGNGRFRIHRSGLAGGSRRRARGFVFTEEEVSQRVEQGFAGWRHFEAALGSFRMLAF